LTGREELRIVLRADRCYLLLVNELLILASLLLATNHVAAASNVIAQATGIAIQVKAPKARPPAATNDPVELEYTKLLEADDAVQAEVDAMIETDHAFAAKGAPFSAAALQLRIDQRFAPVRKAYEDFLQRHPDHARAHIAYGSFLNDLNDESKAVEHWEKARTLEPDKPSAWNNLANFYGHRGPVKKAFEYYAKAIELDPEESVYYHNFGTTVFLFRKDAREFYQIDEQGVFDRALDLYAKAIKLDPTNFPLATDIAQTYYAIIPLRTNQALAAWEYALKIAHDDVEREGIYLHQARFKMNVGQFDEARRHLGAVTNAMYDDLKGKLARNLELKEKKAAGTNAPPAVPSPPGTSDAK
jgi:tetratricopeptide (TPR) repeat protein